jgi:hypothetical protein
VVVKAQSLLDAVASRQGDLLGSWICSACDWFRVSAILVSNLAETILDYLAYLELGRWRCGFLEVQGQQGNCAGQQVHDPGCPSR